jgi:hypothetical protein
VSQRKKFAIYADKIKKNSNHAMSAGYGAETTSQIWTSNPDRWMNDVPTEEPIQGSVLGGAGRSWRLTPVHDGVLFLTSAHRSN